MRSRFDNPSWGEFEVTATYPGGRTLTRTVRADGLFGASERAHLEWRREGHKMGMCWDYEVSVRPLTNAQA
jgi:hypothetical protein